MGSHDAIGPVAGIFYQLERLLFHLAGAEADSSVGIETGDDIVVQGPSETVLEQDKHSVQGYGHPLGDRSVALWKTLAIWLEASRNEGYREAKLYLVTNRPVPDGLARRLGQREQSKDTLNSLIMELRSIASQASESIAKFAASLQETCDDELSQLINRIHLFDAADGTTDPALRRNICSRLHIPDHLDSNIVIDRLLGWVHGAVKNKWRSGQPAWISRQALTNQLFSTMQSIDRQRTLERPERLIPVSEEERRTARLGRFVSHLSLTSCSDDEVDRAVDDFIRFNVEYSRLLEEGEINPLDWDDRGTRLQRRWEMLLRRVMPSRGDTPSEDIGRDMYRQTVEHRESLAGFETREYYLTSGHYHRLADVDQVWWNPDFRLRNHETESLT
jgi:hypothetical protein